MREKARLTSVVEVVVAILLAEFGGLEDVPVLGIDAVKVLVVHFEVVSLSSSGDRISRQSWRVSY